jgi:[protein-PII] uridylyltransferase
MDPRAFFRAKSLELQQRHQKFENTPYSLEPNVKESPGGLRDLQTVIWIARAAGLGRTWPNLAVHGLITRFEVKQLRRNEGTLKLIRARLHTIAGRARTGSCSTCRRPSPRASATRPGTGSAPPSA